MSLNNSYTKKRNSSFSSISSYNNTSVVPAKISSIKVAIRLRPLLPHEDFEYWSINVNKNLISSKSENNKNNETFTSNKTNKSHSFQHNMYLNQLLLDNIFVPQSFKFDKIFTKDITSEKIYLDICQDVIKSFINGINGTIFVYGQTTSGKTYTMLGNVNYPGILPCSLKNLFDLLEKEKKEKNMNYNLYCSYIEIYNEIIHDLIGDSTGCKIIEDNKYGLIIPEAQKICINSFEEGIQLKDIGEEKRQYKDTIINEYSSRSHTIFQLYLETSIHDDRKNTIRNKYSLLNLVDLAGSERINKDERNTNNNINETGYINKSLFALSNVINKLSENKNNYIPYRDSKLTRLLSVALGGGSLVTIICNISPSANNFFQTVSTLRFANRAKNIKLKPAINERIIKKYKPKKENMNENNNLIVEKNGIGGYNIFNNNIYNILNQSGNEYNDSDNFNEKNYETKYYEMLLKNKKLISENNKLKYIIEGSNENNINNSENDFIDNGIEKIKNLLIQKNINNEFKQFIQNHLKEIKMNYINQIKSIQSIYLSKLNELQNIINENFNNEKIENESNEMNKELFSEIELNFDEANNLTDVKLIYEKKEKQLELLMQKYKDNTDYYFQNILDKNLDKSNEELILKEHKEKMDELEQLYEKTQKNLETKFFQKLKEMTNFNKQKKF